MIPLFAILGVALLAAPASAQYNEIPTSVEPSQPVKAIVLQAADGTHSVEIKGGKARVPADVPFPWTVASTRFEPATYTQADLDQHRPLVIREPGHVRGYLRRSNPPREERFALLLRRVGSTTADEFPFLATGDGAFEVRTAAGQSEGVAVRETSGARLPRGDG